MGKMKQKISGKWNFSHQKYNWECEKQKPEYYQIMKMCGSWEGNGQCKKIVMGKGKGKLVENLFLSQRKKLPQFLWDLGNDQFLWDLGND